jgi:hypothetical protein
MPGADGAQQKQPVPQLPETSTHAPIVQTKMHELGHGVVVELVVLDVLLLDDELEDEVELGVPSHAAVAICRS